MSGKSKVVINGRLSKYVAKLGVRGSVKLKTYKEIGKRIEEWLFGVRRREAVELPRRVPLLGT